MPTRKRLGSPLPAIKGAIPAPTEAEIVLLVYNWDTYAPAKYRGMLSARPLGTYDPKARWFYDADRRRYISKSGRVVSPQELRLAYLAFKKAMDKR